MSEKNHANNLSTILISEFEIGLEWNNKCLSELDMLIYDVGNCLKYADVAKYKKLGKEHGRFNVINIAINYFQVEFAEILNLVIDEYLYQQALPFTHYGIYRMLGHSHFNENYPGFSLIQEQIDEKWTKIKKELEESFITDNRENVRGIIKKITVRAFLKIGLIELTESFTYYLRSCAEEFNIHRHSINWVKLLINCIEGQMQFSKYIYYPDDPVIKETIEKSGNLFEKIASEFQKYQLEHYHLWKYNFDDNEWFLYERDLQIIRFYKLNFTGLTKRASFQIKAYCEYLIRIKENKRMLRNRLGDIKRGYISLSTLYKEIQNFCDINRLHVNHLVDYLQTIVDDKGEPKYSILTVKRTVTEMKLITEWLINNPKLNSTYEIFKDNPFEDISFSNTEAFVNTTKYIPEEVIDEILKYIHELPCYVQNAWIIMMHTGIRISDAFSLKDDCLMYDEEKRGFVLQYIPGKVQKHRENRGMENYHRIYVHEIVAKHIQDQIVETAALRLEGQTNRIFINRSFKSMTISQPSRQQSSNLINKLLQKYDIRDAFGEAFHYTHHQCRKTVAVEMLSNGAPLSEVGDYLGHLRERTTSLHYKDIEMKKNAELNAQYFEYHFSEKISNEVRDAFTEEEKGALFKEIRLGARETPEGHGICTKHVSFGPCQKKSCVQCKFLTTGPQKLPMWRKLRSEQEQHMKEMVYEYEKMGLSEYRTFREYEQQYSLLEYYQNTVNQLEEFAVRKGLQFE